MKDERGLYYYPFPQNKRVRMYVCEAEGTVWFRLWNADDPELWEEHGWLPYDAIHEAAKMYTGKDFDPKQAYDVNVAKVVLTEGK
ncbi:MAG: hypothetical protein ACLFVT_04275 [Syntrophobacteria bacterium]